MDNHMTDQPGLTPLRLFILKNLLLFSALAMTLFAMVILAGLQYYVFLPDFLKELVKGNFRIYILVDITFLFILTLLLTTYEKPQRKYLNALAKGEAVEHLLPEAQKRLLNEPIFLIKIVITFLIFALIIIVPGALYFGMDSITIRLNIIDAFQAQFTALVLGLATQVHFTQRYLAILFFPDGKISDVPGARRISQRFRLLIYLAAVNILPLMAIFRANLRLQVGGYPPEVQFRIMSIAIWIIVPISITIAIVLTFLTIGVLVRSMKNLVDTLGQVAVGNLDVRAPVTSNDEIGYVAEMVNEMTRGLRERERMRTSLSLAKEVQQSLLPTSPPKPEGIELAGRSVYCEETGGDYYDFLDAPSGEAVRMIISDVSDHGVQAALTMAGARAYLRQRSDAPGGIETVLSDLNQRLCRDMEESGQFITMFLCKIPTDRKSIQWVSAGHDPGLIYDVEDDLFIELEGRGPALGLSGDAQYQVSERPLFPGQVLVMATDGVWESRGPDGEPFGRERIKCAVRRAAKGGAQAVLDALFSDLIEFTGRDTWDDDVTVLTAALI